MNKIIFIFFTFLFLSSCSEESKSERYFVNCVKDARKVLIVIEEAAVAYCEQNKRLSPDTFKYYKGKVFSKKR